MNSEYQKIIEEAWENRSLLSEATTQDTIREIIDLLDKG
ncbi:MAG: 2,3,4,5-tetrahydropyridine-2,6-dicarboxylate N-succinyltransferase, partial [Bacteroidota bacterium]|nr:2,3,4,5-tetrahydropyridine-2,6-dicarboxylate N-succinyltransferase [Bacteroidota bacterium]